MSFSSDAAIERTALGMIACTLPKAEWTHEAHFATALWLCRHRPAMADPAEVRTLIRRYNESLGGVNSDTSGYHHTITVASMAGAAAHVVQAPADRPLHETLAALMASPLGHPDWLLAHWTHSRLFSPEARREWAAPDLAPLPF